MGRGAAVGAFNGHYGLLPPPPCHYISLPSSISSSPLVFAVSLETLLLVHLTLSSTKWGFWRGVSESDCWFAISVWLLGAGDSGVHLVSQDFAEKGPAQMETKPLTVLARVKVTDVALICEDLRIDLFEMATVIIIIYLFCWRLCSISLWSITQRKGRICRRATFSSCSIYYYWSGFCIIFLNPFPQFTL